MSDLPGQTGPGLAGMAMRVVDALQRHAVIVLALAAALSVACGFYAARNFEISTDLGAVLSPDLPFERDQVALSEAFPQLDNGLAVVIDGPSPALAREAAAKLARRLAATRSLFSDVYRPESDFFIRNGLLYLDPAALQKLTDRLSQAQPLISTLAADPSPRGIAGLMEQAVRPEAAEAGAALSGLGPLLESLAQTVEAAANGRTRPVPWSALMGAAGEGSTGARQFLLVQPRLDTTSLTPAGPALDAVRQLAGELGMDEAHGFRVRLTGPAALEEAQIDAATEGATASGLLCLGLLALLLGIGLHSLRLAAAILLVLAMTFVWSVALALVLVGPFNLISIAFAVLFIGLGADFGIQFAVRYGEELGILRTRHGAVRAAFLSAWRPLTLAAAAAAISFFSTAPTDYRGLAELGVVAGTSMAVAVLGSLVLLPAFLSVIPAGNRHVGRARYGGFGRLALHRHGRWIVGLALLAGLAALPFAVTVPFDFDPARVQDPRAEAVQVFDEMRRVDAASLYTIDVLTPNLPSADAVADRLNALPTVKQALTLDTFVPDAQETSRTAIDELSVILPPFSLTAAAAAALNPGGVRDALTRLGHALARVPASAPYAAAASRLRAALDAFAAAHGQDDAAVLRLGHALVGDLPQTLATLQAALAPDTVTREGLPPDLRARYVNPRTGAARVEVTSSLDLNRPENLRRFVEDVQRIAPRATGASVVLVETGRAVARAFRLSSVLAVVGIFALLFLVLRDAKRVLLVFLPLVLAAVLTTATMKAAGIAFNLGNVIVLPLLIGLGVAFGIYFVLRWAEGIALEAVLRTSMPDAVLLSGLATMVSFGSMALSGNPAMATLGVTLSIALFYVLVCVLVVLPAVLALVDGRRRRDVLPAQHSPD